jgi:serine/threonine-protein kinase HipA
MSVNGKFSGITRGDLLAIADRFGIGTAPKVLKAVTEAVKAWPEFARFAEVNAKETAWIASLHLGLE